MNPEIQPDRSELIGVIGVLLIAAYFLIRAARWFACKPRSPDPWGEDVAAQLAEDDAVPLCHRCLTPHDPLVYFCPDCGAPVGTYTHWLPYPQLFALGHTLRLGTEGNFRRTPVTIAGFLLLSLVEYSIFVPVYWVLFLQRLGHGTPPASGGGAEPAKDE